MKKKKLNFFPKCTHCNYSLKIDINPFYRQLYFLDIRTKLGTDNFSSSSKATWKVVQLFFIVEDASHCIFSKYEATTVFDKTHDKEVTDFYTVFAIKPSLIAKQQDHNTNELFLSDPRTK